MKVLDAGIRAPNGGNQQRWRFIVIKNPDTKRWIQERYRSTNRRPVEEVTFDETWGKRWETRP